MEIQEVSIDQLIPYGFNNVKHPESQVNRIANSIKEFGFNVPLIVNRDNIIIAGHGRLEAAKKLGLKKVPVVRKDALTPAQEKAYRILDNKLTRDSEWDFDNIQVEFDFLEEEGFDFTKWGLEDLIPKGQKENADSGESQASGSLYQEQYGVIVVCQTSAEQEQIYTELQEKGYNCKVVVT